MFKRLWQNKAEKPEKEDAAAKSDIPAEESPKEAQTQADLEEPHHQHGSHTDDAASSSSLHDVSPVLDASEEAFLQRILEDEDGPRPPLPPRSPLVLDWPSDSESSPETSDSKEPKTKAASDDDEDAKGKKPEKKKNRLSLLFSRRKKTEDQLVPVGDVPDEEAERETKDLSRVLDQLHLSTKDNKVVSASSEVSETLQKFTLVFKDLVNGVPTAYDDLMKLIQDRDKAMAKGFDKLPKSLQKLVTQLPAKLTATLGPEVAAAVAKSQGLESQGGMQDAIEKILLPQNLLELVTKPGALVAMLRAIVETLKARWPAFIGVNVLWSVALTLLMLMLWYCYKRGREERLLKEQGETAGDGSGSDTGPATELETSQPAKSPDAESARRREITRSGESSDTEPAREPETPQFAKSSDAEPAPKPK